MRGQQLSPRVLHFKPLNRSTTYSWRRTTRRLVVGGPNGPGQVCAFRRQAQKREIGSTPSDVSASAGVGWWSGNLDDQRGTG